MPFSTENNITNDRRIPNFLKPDPNKPNLVALTLDYDGNITTDIDMALLTIIEPVGIGTTVDPISNTVIPKPPSFTPTQNPSIGFSMNKTLLAKNIKVAIGATSGEIIYVSTPSLPSTDDRSPYFYPPIIDPKFLNLNNIVTGIGSTNASSPLNPVITKISMRTEYEETTQIMKQTMLTVGIGTSGVIYIEEKKGNEIKLNSDLIGNVTGDVDAGIVTTTSISNGTNVLSFSVSGSDLTLTITGVGSTTLKLA